LFGGGGGGGGAADVAGGTVGMSIFSCCWDPGPGCNENIGSEIFFLGAHGSSASFNVRLPLRRDACCALSSSTAGLDETRTDIGSGNHQAWLAFPCENEGVGIKWRRHGKGEADKVR
jgi:hypothetical protein